MQFNKFVIFLPQTHFLALDNLPQFRESKVIGSYGLSLFLWVCINDSLTTVFSVKLGNSCVTATNSSLPWQKVKLDPKHCKCKVRSVAKAVFIASQIEKATLL